MDITPLIPADRQVIDGYRTGQFRVAGTVHLGSVLVFPERTVAWAVTELSQVTAASLEVVRQADPPIELLLLGCGSQGAVLLPASLRRELRESGLRVETMDTGAACRTYNILLAEARRVAAALIAL